MRSRSVFLWILTGLLLAASGCCGGYSVVRTTVASRANLDEGQGEAGRGGGGEAYVLHYARLGEPASSCGSGQQYMEDLFIRVPSIRVGDKHTIGQKGVVALYSRRQEGPPIGAKRVSGSVRIVERAGEEVTAALEVTISLPSGDDVELDDEYTFHPDQQ